MEFLWHTSRVTYQRFTIKFRPCVEKTAHEWRLPPQRIHESIVGKNTQEATSSGITFNHASFYQFQNHLLSPIIDLIKRSLQQSTSVLHYWIIARPNGLFHSIDAVLYNIEQELDEIVVPKYLAGVDHASNLFQTLYIICFTKRHDRILGTTNQDKAICDFS